MRGVVIGLASKLVIEHKFAPAKDVFEQLLKSNPADIEVMALYFLGAVNHEKKEFERAIHLCETALNYFPEKQKRI